MFLEDIDEDDDALLCITNQTTCCRPPYSGSAIGNWYFPNETRVPGSGRQWDFHRTRGQMVVRMHRRRGGVEGIYRCVIPDAMNVNQTIYIGVYSASTGEWCIYIYIYICLHFNFYSTGEWLNALSALKFEILELPELVYILQLMRPGIC